jgi:hypothetical protein
MDDAEQAYSSVHARRMEQVATGATEAVMAARQAGARHSGADLGRALFGESLMVPPGRGGVLHLYVLDDGEEHVYCARDATEALRAHWYAFGAAGPDDPGMGVVQVQVERLADDRQVVVFNESREGFRWEHGAANVDLESMAVPAPQESMERGQVVQGWKVAQSAKEWCRLFQHLMEMGSSSSDVVVRAFAVRLYTTAA